MYCRADYQLGEWKIYSQLNQVVNGCVTRHLEPKIMDVLCYLCRHAGQVVTKDRLLNGVWPDTFVSDESLIRAVSKIRQVLSDSACSPRYLETIPKRGYRLLVKVVVPDAQSHCDHQAVV